MVMRKLLNIIYDFLLKIVENDTYEDDYVRNFSKDYTISCYPKKKMG